MKFKKITITILIFILGFAPMSLAENTSNSLNTYLNNTSDSRNTYLENISDDLNIYLGNTSDDSNTYSETTSDILNIYAESVILIDNKTGTTLYEKNSEKKMYPASTTKILTAILTLEKGNLEDEVIVSKSAIESMKAGYSSAYLSEGEIISVENLLKCLLIPSANDAANVLAEYISGSISEFVKLMNEKVKELGCTNTHFVTTNGLHDDNHYTTAKDMSIIARYCMQNSTFRNIVSTQSCTIPATNKSDKRYYTNTNDLINTKSEYYYKNCIGIKTGFTSQAQNCLVSACKKDKMELIAVVFGASLTESGKSARYVDSKTLYDYAFSNYSISTIVKKSDVIKTIEIKNATDETKSLDLILENDITALVKNTEKTITPEISLNDDISAPIATNTVLGTATYTISGVQYTENLLASHDVQKNDLLINVLRISLVMIFMILILLTVRTNRNSKKLNKGKH